MNLDHTVLDIGSYLDHNINIQSIAVICAGTLEHFNLPDILCAGRFLDKLEEEIIVDDLGRAAQMLYNMSKENLPETLKQSIHGQMMLSLGLNQDIVYCASVNILPILAVMDHGEINQTYVKE